jgi:hypothetical protein
MRKLIGAFVGLALTPSTAWAGWKLEVEDETTHEVRTFRPPENAPLAVPIKMGKWSCIVKRAPSKKIMILDCRANEIWVRSVASKRLLGYLFLSQDPSEKPLWTLTLSFER